MDKVLQACMRNNTFFIAGTNKNDSWNTWLIFETKSKIEDDCGGLSSNTFQAHVNSTHAKIKDFYSIF